MNVSKEIKVKIYLKCRLRPFVAIVDNEKQIETLRAMIETKQIVTFGILTFSSDQFKYLIIC